ncbi:MAG: short-chain dehydrogenase [Candidatus Entotheonella factor]|uniref:Short-chain dehydrogenase n=1 Tax=Entotheonella factor TaxID=1429438 RepID=W4LEN9_ENTF1|nr:SDR family NAD(P)-dependent oxidoreductase [Candidatus Entotheonella palauensis]ETW96379.1 MAG: short-chain dehydrogenase [Candidatus Entotheonella factor]
MTARLQGQIAVVTGAAMGIGRASAIRLAQEGAHVACLDLEAEALDHTAQAIRDCGVEALPLQLDCTDAEAVRSAFDAIHAQFGQVDILFNNVGQSARQRATEFWQSDEDIWRFVLEVSLLTAMRCSRLVAPQMRQRRSGKIINISSESAFYGDTRLVDYAAAKMGIVGFTRALARELAPFQVNVNAVAPGAIRTRAHDGIPPETLAEIRHSTPMGYVAEPEDVAHAVAFLASAESRYITGQTLIIDGGRWMV